MRENTIIKYTMTYGLYLGIAFSLMVIILKFTGGIHQPGDVVSMINVMILSVGMFVFGKRYRDEFCNGEFSYGSAFKLLILLSLFSAIIYSFFSYWYYAVVEPNGISSYVEQVHLVYSQNPALSEGQVDAMVSIFESTLTPGVMAFIVFFAQSTMGIIAALTMAFFIKSPQLIEDVSR